ncbi:MAG: 50S ribosomal protein L24 [Dehalococcoidia bacterium]|jgi:large subunit ribosomal protein L24|nr:50S ribosomal protein L24 [Dehalococcoidia bacterium]|tara:strand:- start:534 stop:845 length:312 start_codon:yes stop_codon:yes gene_type:complete
MTIKREDTVQILAGKDKGKRGKVQAVLKKDGLVLVEGVNIIKKHTRQRQNVRQAGIVEKEAPLNISNVVIVCNNCDKPVRIGKKFLEDQRKVRICSSCQEVID